MTRRERALLRATRTRGVWFGAPGYVVCATRNERVPSDGSTGFAAFAIQCPVIRGSHALQPRIFPLGFRHTVSGNAPGAAAALPEPPNES